MNAPVLSNKHCGEPSVFTAENLLREARRQKGLAPKNVPPVCFAHVTNQMAMIEGDFEKGRDNGSHDALEVIRLTARAWHAAGQPRPQPPAPSAP